MPPDELERPLLGDVAAEVRCRLLGDGARVHHVEDHEQDRHDEEPLGNQPQRPEERHAAQVPEEERRVAERRQQAGAVRDHEDEEDRDVADVLPLGVGLEQRTDEQHAGAGRADQVREQRAAGEKRRC